MAYRARPVFLGVALDLDGVVVDTPRFHYLAWRHAFLTIGLTVTDKEVHELEGSKDGEVALGIGRSRGLDLTVEDRESLSRLKQDKFREILRPSLIGGTADFIWQLKRSGMPVALVTGTTREGARAALEGTGLADVFELVVTGDDVTQGKPHPEPYALAVRGLGIPPRSCLAVENAPAGVRSATAAGLFCVAITTTLTPDQLREASIVFDGIRGLADWFCGAE